MDKQFGESVKYHQLPIYGYEYIISYPGDKPHDNSTDQESAYVRTKKTQ